MKVSKRDSTIEKRILTGMIVDDVLLGYVSDKWESDLFNSKWSREVGRWCVQHYREYGRAPGKAIEGRFESFAEKQQDNDIVELVERFLSSLSDDYEALTEESQSEYLRDRAGEYFNKVKANRLSESVQGSLDNGDVQSAMDSIHNFERVELGAGAAVDILQDSTALQDAFEQQHDVLVKYPNDLGDFFGTSLERDALIAFMGPEKRGKTFWLMDLSWRGMLQRKRTAFFAVGDMSQEQMLRRFATRALRRPLGARKIKCPKLLTWKQEGILEVDRSDHNYTKPVSWKQAWKAFQAVQKRRVRSKDPYLRMSVHPNSSINVGGIRSVLAGWEREGWTPDIIVIDYADILAPPDGRHQDVREETNTTWKQLRRMSQELHCLVVTATQSDAPSYSAEVIRKQNFSEDKRKLAHVTGIIGLNATDQEKSDGVMRLNWVVRRESGYTEGHCVHVAGCLAIANPAMMSTF